MPARYAALSVRYLQYANGDIFDARFGATAPAAPTARLPPMPPAYGLPRATSP